MGCLSVRFSCCGSQGGHISMLEYCCLCLCGVCMHLSNRRETREAWAVLASNVKTQVLVWQRGEGGEIAAATWPLLMWLGGRTWCGGAQHGVPCSALSAALPAASSIRVLRLTLAERMNAFPLNSSFCGCVYTLYWSLPIIISQFWIVKYWIWLCSCCPAMPLH